MKVWHSAIKTLRYDGFRAALLVAITKGVNFAMLFVVTPLWLVRRAISFNILVRFGEINAVSYGALALNPELYLSARERGLTKSGAKIHLDIWCFSSRPCNHQLAKMVARKLFIFPFSIVRPFIVLDRFFKQSDDFCIPNPIHLDIFKSWLKEDVLVATRTHLSFTAAEENSAIAEMNAIGIGVNSEYVCFGGRDSAYLPSVMAQAFPYTTRDFSYHDYRNMEINNVVPAMEALAAKGIVSVRMGSVVSQKLKTSSPQIIDYASCGVRSELLDIYLPSKCAFFVSTSSGISNPAHAFRRPVAYFNIAPLSTLQHLNVRTVFIPKKYWLITENRFMALQEIFAIGADAFYETRQFYQAGIRLIENSPDEICDLVSEFQKRIAGTWHDNPEDLKLQNAFFSLWPENSRPTPILYKIGLNFLKNNIDVLFG